MIRKAGLVFAGVAGLVITLGGAIGQDKEIDVHDIMHVVGGTKKEKGACAKCAAAGKGMQWDEARKYAKQLAECGTAIGKSMCPKGDPKSWEKLSKRFDEQTQAIAKAADAKDAKAFNAAIVAFTSSCKECHKSHK